MSIIERAVDRLTGKEGGPDQKKKRRAEDRKSSSRPSPGSKRARLSAPEPKDSPPLHPLERHQPPASSRLPELPEVSTPEISFEALSLEGILLPTANERTRLAEEIRMIKRPILLKITEEEGTEPDHPNLIAVTSSVASEGKTFSILNLAISMAMEMDKTVLLVDADLAKPGLSRLLSLSERPGLTEYLLGDETDLRSLLLSTDIPKLKILPAGGRHQRSTELLASNKMRDMLDELALRYTDRILLFDSPPLLATSEASVLAQQMGQIIMVVESAVTPQFLVKEALGQLDSTDNVSLILNKCKQDFLTSRMGGYGYGYGYGYGSETDK